MSIHNLLSTLPTYDFKLGYDYMYASRNIMLSLNMLKSCKTLNMNTNTVTNHVRSDEKTLIKMFILIRVMVIALIILEKHNKR